MSSFTVQCPKCKLALKAAPEFVGKNANCKQCGEKFVVQGPIKQVEEFQSQNFRPHWFWAAHGNIKIAATIQLVILYAFYSGYSHWVLWIPFFLLFTPLLRSLLESRLTRLEIDDSKSVWTHGIAISKDTEVFHRDIYKVDVQQSLLQRIFGYGDLKIASQKSTPEGKMQYLTKSGKGVALTSGKNDSVRVQLKTGLGDVDFTSGAEFYEIEMKGLLQIRKLKELLNELKSQNS